MKKWGCAVTIKPRPIIAAFYKKDGLSDACDEDKAIALCSALSLDSLEKDELVHKHCEIGRGVDYAAILRILENAYYKMKSTGKRPVFYTPRRDY